MRDSKFHLTLLSCGLIAACSGMDMGRPCDAQGRCLAGFECRASTNTCEPSTAVGGGGGATGGGGGAMVTDSGQPDSGEQDAGPVDAGSPDAGPPDAGPPDAGPPDAGATDAGPPDAGPPDAGPPDAGPPVPELVDLGISAGPPLALTLDGSFVYWTDGTNIYRKALDGAGGRMVVATHALPSGNSGYAIGEIDVDATWVYFLGNGTQPGSGGSPPQVIRRVKDGSGANEVIATMPGGVPQQAGAFLIFITAVDPNYLYFTASQYRAGGVYQLLKSNPSLGSPLPNISQLGTYLAGFRGHLAVSGNSLFVTNFETTLSPQPGIVACTLPSCSGRLTIASFAEAGGVGSSTPDPSLAVDSNNIYWAQAPGGTAVASSPRGGGGVSFLATLTSGASHVVADDTDNWVRFITGGPDGGIRKVLKGVQGQAPVTVIRNQNVPLGLRMNATHLYWGEFGTNKIWRVAR